MTRHSASSPEPATLVAGTSWQLKTPSALPSHSPMPMGSLAAPKTILTTCAGVSSNPFRAVVYDRSAAFTEPVGVRAANTIDCREKQTTGHARDRPMSATAEEESPPQHGGYPPP